MRVLITGGAGFIGGHVTEHMVAQGHTVAVADKFSYAGKAKNLAAVLPHIDLLIGSLSTGDLAQRCAEWAPEWVVHMAGDTHVDMAIADPFRFQVNNVYGTCALLEQLRRVPSVSKAVVYSTDEVFGPTPPDKAFSESTPFRPSNAYSASKCGVEGLATSFFVTHGLPTVIVRPCNTYGPRQHPEKVIPKFIGQIMRGDQVTIYGDGNGARDWLHTADHARAIEMLLLNGEPGTSYNLAAEDEHSDIEIFETITDIMEEHGLAEKAAAWPPLVTYTPGRPGHDRRYMMDGARLRGLGWRPTVPFMEGFRDTVMWCAINQGYWDDDVVRFTDG